MFADVSSGMRDREWTILPAVPREGWVSRTLRERGFEPIFTGGDRGGWDLRHLSELLRLIRRHDVDLVHTHLFGSALYGAVAATLCRRPAVATFHGDWDLREATGYRRMKIPVVDRLCDRKVFVSAPLRRTCVSEFGIRRGGSTVVENGIDTDRFRPRADDSFRTELGVTEDDFLVGSVGNVRPAKNHGMLLRVAAKLVHEGDDVQVVVVGKREGELFERLCRQRRELGLGTRVHFAGFREDIDRVFNSFDAYVLTSDSEGFSLTTIQAMASALPVVATRCGGPETLVDEGETGFLVDRRDVTAMANVLARLRSNDALRDRVGRRAREKVRRRYSADRMLDAYERLYRALLDDLGDGRERD